MELTSARVLILLRLYGAARLPALLGERGETRAAGDPPVGDVPPWADSTNHHPVNPFALARLMTGKVVQTRAELVAAFGMPFEKIVAVGGPLYAPDLAAVAALATQRPPDNAPVFRGKAAGAVDPMGVAASKSRPPLPTLPSVFVRPLDTTRVRDWVTPVQDPQGPRHFTPSEAEAEAQRAVAALERIGVPCERWSALSANMRANYAQDFLDGRLSGAPTSVLRAVTEPTPQALALTDRITRLCANRATPRPSARGVRDAFRLLQMMLQGSNEWSEMTCRAQFDALFRLNGDLVPPAVTIDEMKRELFAQWLELLFVSVDLHGGTYYQPARSWFYWLYAGTYTNRPPRVTDAHQGCVGNCFFVAALAGVAWVRPDIITARSWRGGALPAGRLSGASNSRPDVTITMSDPRSGANVDRPVTMSDRLPLCVNPYDLCDGPRPFCHTGDNNQTWPDLWEKAMRVFVSGHDDPPMVAVDPRDPARNATVNAPLYFLSESAHPANVLAGGEGQTMIAWLGASVENATFGAWARGYASAVGANQTAADVWRYLDEHCDASGKVRSVIIASSVPPEWSPPAGIVPWHYYTLLGIDRARRMVYLRNPWGHVSPGAPDDQRGTWMGLTLGLDDGVGAVTFESFFNNFNSMSGNWYGPRRTGDFGLNQRWGFYSLARFAP